MSIADLTGSEVSYLGRNRVINISALANAASLSKVWPDDNGLSHISLPIQNDGLPRRLLEYVPGPVAVPGAAPEMCAPGNDSKKRLRK